MRFLLLALAASLLGAGLFLFTQADNMSPGPGYIPDPVQPATDSTSTDTPGNPESEDLTSPNLETPDPITPNTAPATSQQESIPRTPTRSFRGAALIQEKDQLVRGARTGTIELDLLYRGVRERTSISVSNGQFQADVPRAVRLELVGGIFESKPVHFEKPQGQFDPTDSDYALIGVVTPAVTLDVVDGAQASPLQDITITRANDATSAVLGERAPTQDTASPPPLVTGATSPVTLPYIDAQRPVWLSVSATGYAATNVLIDPRKPQNASVRLYPSANLKVRVTGSARGALRMLVLTRDEGEGRTPHTGTFTVSHPSVETTPNALVFPIRGLAGITHSIRAMGYDESGVTTDLGKTLRVDLNANDEQTVELRID